MRRVARRRASPAAPLPSKIDNHPSTIVNHEGPPPPRRSGSGRAGHDGPLRGESRDPQHPPVRRGDRGFQRAAHRAGFGRTRQPAGNGRRSGRASLPGGWHGGRPARPLGRNSATPHRGADDDDDGDGTSNHFEFQAGTDPTNPASVFKLVSHTIAPSQATLRFRSGSGRNYQLQHSNNLTTWTLVPPHKTIPCTGGEVEVTGSQGQGFDRLAVKQDF